MHNYSYLDKLIIENGAPQESPLGLTAFINGTSDYFIPHLSDNLIIMEMRWYFWSQECVKYENLMALSQDYHYAKWFTFKRYLENVLSNSNPSLPYAELERINSKWAVVF